MLGTPWIKELRTFGPDAVKCKVNTQNKVITTVLLLLLDLQTPAHSSKGTVHLHVTGKRELPLSQRRAFGCRTQNKSSEVVIKSQCTPSKTTLHDSNQKLRGGSEIIGFI